MSNRRGPSEVPNGNIHLLVQPGGNMYPVCSTVQVMSKQWVPRAKLARHLRYAVLEDQQPNSRGQDQDQDNPELHDIGDEKEPQHQRHPRNVKLAT